MSRRARWEWEDALNKIQAHRTAEGNANRTQLTNIHSEQQQVHLRIAKEQAETQRAIADSYNQLQKEHIDKQLALTEKIENKKIALQELETREKNNAQISMAVINERKELQQQLNAYRNKYSLNQQRLELSLIKAEDEFQKEITLRNGQYKFELKKDEQAQNADYKKTELIKKHEKRIKKLELESLKELKELDIQQEQWRITTEYNHKLGEIEAKTNAYQQKLLADTEADSKMEATKSINYAFKQMIDTKFKIMLLKAQKELLSKNELTEKEIEEILKNTEFYWNTKYS